MRNAHLLLSFLFICCFLSPSRMEADSDWRQQLQHDIPQRLLHMDLPFRVDYTAEVREELSGYLRSGQRSTAYMLGRSSMYFPIFDYYLEAYQLPKTLKYIPLLESRLQPSVESGAGAAGLWQFMPATGRSFGLRINEWVDERKNPYRSTDAAMRYLSRLYKQFDDWSLALAAYNCGPGRVKRAVEASGCDNFWDIEHLLPQQTRRYLPRIIATIYVAENYDVHGIDPVHKASQHQNFSVFRIHQDIDLSVIAQHCNISEERLLNWNPGYSKLYAPAPLAGKPYYLILPQRALPFFQTYIIKESRKTGENYAVAVLKSQIKPVDLGRS